MNDQSETQKLWAHEGEVVTCINGHAICDIARSLYVGERRDNSHFINWRIAKPVETDPVGKLRCAQCRGVWIRGSTRGGYQFHFDNGWR